MKALGLKEPLYQRIYSAIKQRIDAGEWGLGAILPTENELCESYQVSRGTVRQVMAKLERDGMVRRERGRGTFLIHPGLEKPGRMANHPTLSFIVPYVRDSYVSSILIGVESAARAGGYAVVFSHVENDLDKQELALRTAVRQGAEGIILYPVNSRDASPILSELTQQNFPLVLVDRYIRCLYTAFVASDNFGGGLIATRHLLSLGHRRIALLSWTEMVTTMEHRRAGYRQALLEAGLAFDPCLEWEVEGYPDIDIHALTCLLQQSPRPTAVFAANDQLALAVQRTARALKLSIPDDLALVGFDNLDISSQLDVPLTTIAQPAVEIGKAAGAHVIGKISGHPHGADHTILPVKLVIRQSCGSARGIQHHDEAFSDERDYQTLIQRR